MTIFQEYDPQTMDYIVEYAHMIDGDIWIRQYVHDQDTQEIVKEYCRKQLRDAFVDGQARYPWRVEMDEPTVSIEFNEILKSVTVRATTRVRWADQLR